MTIALNMIENLNIFLFRKHSEIESRLKKISELFGKMQILIEEYKKETILKQNFLVKHYELLNKLLSNMDL